LDGSLVLWGSLHQRVKRINTTILRRVHRKGEQVTYYPNVKLH
jgi:hypothetical protein